MAGLRLPARQAGDLPLQEVHQQLDQAASGAWRQPTPQGQAWSYAGWGGTRIAPGSHMAAILLPAQNPGLRATAARARPAGASPPHLCSQCSASWSMLAGQYGWRLEVTFHDAKQHLGFGQAQNQAPQAVERTAPFAGVVYSLVLLWAAAHFQQGGTLSWSVRPWHRSKTAVAFPDLLMALRQELWRTAFLRHQCLRGAPKIRLQCPAALSHAPHN